MKRWCMPLIASVLMFMFVLTGCSQTGALGGTDWTVVEVLSSAQPDIVDADVSFEANGFVTTTTTHSDGHREVARRPYAVHDALISVRRPEGDLHVLHRIDGEMMWLTAESFQARLVRLD